MPASFQVGIVPGSAREPNAHRWLAVFASPTRIERVDNATDVTDCSTCRVGVSAVGDDLNVSLATGQEPALEILIDLDHQQHSAFIDRLSEAAALPLD